MPKKQIYRLHDLCSGGVQQKVDDLLSKNNEVWDMTDVSFSKFGNITSDLAYGIFSTDSVDKNIKEFPIDRGRLLVGMNNSTVYKWDTSAWGVIIPQTTDSWNLGSDKGENATYALVTQDAAYSNYYLVASVDYKDSSQAKIVPYYDGNTSYKIEYGSTGKYLRGRCVATLGNVLIVGGPTWDSSSTGPSEFTYLNRVYFSKPGTLQLYEDSEAASPANSTRYVEVDGPVRAVSVYGNYIVIFSDVVSLVDAETLTTVTKLSDSIITNAMSVVSAFDTLSWIAFDGIYMWQGAGRPVKISRSLTNTDKNGWWDYVLLSKSHQFRAFEDEDSIKYYVRVNEGDGEIPMVFEFDMALKAWKREAGYTVTGATRSLQDDSLVTLFAGNAGGHFGVQEYRGGTTYKPLTFETRNIYIDGADTIKTIYGIGVLYKANTDKLKIEYCLDEDTSEWITLVEPDGTMELPSTNGRQIMQRIPFNAVCTSIRFRITCSDTSTYIDISALYIQYSIKGTFEMTNITNN